MHHLRSLRRLAVGAALAGASVGAIGAGPALAAGNSTTCTFDPATHTVTLTDGTGNQPLGVGVNAAGVPFFGIPKGAVQVTQGPGSFPILCVGQGTVATVTNTDTINITRSAASGTERNVTIDESAGVFGPGATPDPDGHGEVKINISGDASTPTDLNVVGTSEADTIRISRLGDVNLNAAQDSDTDIHVTGGAQSVTVNGGGGGDFISGKREPQVGGPPSATVPLLLNGEGGDDLLMGGLAPDVLSGGDDGDFLFSASALTTEGVDRLDGGAGFDNASFDSSDILFGSGIEGKFLVTVGRVALAPQALDADAAKPARLTMSWTHPKAWRDLRTVSLQLERGTEQVGTINIHPRGGGLTAHGKVALLAGSRVTHHGKTVTARLAFRLARSLAGQNLRVAVQATDRHGHKQLEPDAGSIRVLK